VIFSGTWDFAVVTENGTGTPTVVLKQEGTKVSGTYESGRMGVRALKGTIAGDSISFALEGGDSPVTLVFRGAIRSATELTECGGVRRDGGGRHLHRDAPPRSRKRFDGRAHVLDAAPILLRLPAEVVDEVHEGDTAPRLAKSTDPEIGGDPLPE